MICYGVPNGQVLNDQYIINIDVTVIVIVKGFHGNTSSLFFAGQPWARPIKANRVRLRGHAEGLETMGAGATTGAIGFAIDKYVTRKGFYVVREIGGHGNGRGFHEDPFIPSFGKKARGEILHKWETITIEPMVNETAAKFECTPFPAARSRSLKLRTALGLHSMNTRS